MPEKHTHHIAYLEEDMLEEVFDYYNVGERPYLMKQSAAFERSMLDVDCF